MNQHRTVHPLIAATSTILILLCAVCAYANPWAEAYVFGDSLSDNGNLYSLSQQTFPPSPPYAQNNSNGDTWPSYFQDALGIPVHNLAVGGAFSGPVRIPIGGAFLSASNTYSISEPFLPNLPGLQEQVDGFVASHPQGVNSDAIYVIWAGHNDLFIALGNPTLAAEIIPAIPENIVNAICHLNAYGARHFAVGNLVNMGLSPFARAVGASGAITAIIEDQVNPGILQALQNVGTACADSILVFDTFDYLNQAVANPDQFGLTNVEDPCLLTVSDPSTQCGGHLFWDTVHPTTAASQILAGFFRRDFGRNFCGTGDQHPGLRGRPSGQPPPVWRGVCYGTP